MTKIVMMALVVMVLGCRDRGPTGPSFPGAGLYFPLAAGNMWEYDLTTNSSGFDTTYLKVIILDSGFIDNGLRWYRTIDICPSRSTPLWCAAFAHQGNKTLARRLLHRYFAEPQPILDMPLFVAKQWTLEDTSHTWPNGEQFSRLGKRYVRGMETVCVPAGRFSAYRIEDSTRHFDRILRPSGDFVDISYFEHADEWFAQGVGLVKQVATYTWNYNGSGDYGYREIYTLRRYNIRPTE